MTGALDQPRTGWELLRHYRRAWLPADALAGVTVAALLVPQCMAYAEIAGLPPETGFHAALLALLAYAALGTSRHLGVGPEPGTAILAAAGVSAVAGGDPARYLSLMSLLALLVGVICIVSHLARLGFIAELLSKPVLVGYITGVGLTLLSSQLQKMTGVPIDADTFVPRVGQFLTRLADVHGPTLGVGLGSLGAILVLKRYLPRVPAALLVVGAAGVVVAVSSLTDHGVAVVGSIPSGIPSLGMPELGRHDIRALLPTALGIAVVGYSDNVITARSVGNRLGYRIDSNRELLALGAENVASAMSAGFPVSSSASRTAVAASLGSRTQLVGVIAAATLAVALIVGRPLLEHIPAPALAAVIVAAAIAIIDLPGYRSLWEVSRAEFVLGVVAALGVMVFDVLVGVLIAVALSVIVAFYRIARPHDAVLGAAADLDGWVDVGDVADATTLPGLLVYRFDAPLLFANVSWFEERLRRALDANPGQERWVILDFEGIGSVDASAADALGELVESLHAAGIDTIGVARANDQAIDRLTRAGVLAPRGSVRSFLTINQAVRAYGDASG